MGNLFRPVALATLLFVAILPARAQQFVQARSGNFLVVTDVKEDEARQVCLRLEQMRSIYGAIFHRGGHNPTALVMPVQTVVFAMRDPAKLEAVGGGLKAAAAGEPRAYAGPERWFLNGLRLDSGSNLFPESPQNDRALRLLGLLMLERNYPRTPAWFDQGFASYFGAFRPVKDGMELGRAIPRTPGAAKSWLPMEKLLTEPFRQPVADQTTYESWMLVHWLVSNSRLSDAGHYFDLVMNRGVPPRDAWHEAFSMSLEELDKELAAYDPAKNIKTFPLPYVETAAFPVRKLGPAEVQVAVANMALDSPGEEDAALKTLTADMREYPSLVEAHRALIYSYMKRKDFNNALEHIHRAVELEDLDPAVHYWLAVALNHGATDGVAVESADVKLSPALTATLLMDPGYAPAYELRGAGRLASGKSEAGLLDLRQACALLPRDDHCLLLLAEAMETTEKLDNARALLKVLSNSQNPEIAQKAKEEFATSGRELKKKNFWAAQGYTKYSEITDPKWSPPANAAVQEEETKPEVGPDTRKTEFLKGILVDVECSDQRTSATLRVAAGGKAWKLRVADRAHVLLMNRENFSCAWRNLKVSVNYKSSGAQAGDVVSIEMVE